MPANCSAAKQLPQFCIIIIKRKNQTYMSEIKKEEQSDTTQTQKTSYIPCTLCPRACHVDRTAGQKGRCHVDARIRVARAALHVWEEPCLSGRSGSGAVFFSGCALGCIFCQNREIASGKAGLVISEARLAEIFLELQEKGTDTTLEAVLADMRKRDHDDSSRAAAPLKAAEDAVLVDTTGLTLEEAVSRLKKLAKERIEA